MALAVLCTPALGLPKYPPGPCTSDGTICLPSGQNNTAENWTSYGNSLSNMGQYDSAVKAYYEAIKMNPQYAVPYATGEYWTKKGDADFDQATTSTGWRTIKPIPMWNRALSAYNIATEVDPQYTAAWNNKGNVLVALGKYADAINAYGEAIRTSPQSVDPWYNKALVLVKLQMYTEAVDAFDNLTKLTPGDKTVWYNKGILLITLGRYNESLEPLDQAIAIMPSYRDAWIAKAQALQALHRDTEADMAFEKARELDPQTKSSIYKQEYVGPQSGYDLTTGGALPGMENQNVLRSASPYAFPSSSDVKVIDET